MNTAENIMQNLALKMPKAFDWPKVGEVVEGRVMKKSAKNLYIDLGIWGIGIVYGIEFINAQDIIKNLKVGASVFAKIVEVQNESGFRELSLAEAKAQKSWDLIRELKKTNQAITTKILSVNRGGLIVEISGIAGFLPVSQLASEHYPRVEGGDKNKMLEGLIHISELDWQLVENPADLVKVGDEVAAQIIDITNDRISLSLKRLKIDPWKTASELLEKGMLIEGLVKKFNPFGAFVEIVCHPNECLQGLCHISEFGSDEKMNAALEVGKKYQFKILAFVPEEHRMSLGVIL